jgi:hypothetical protein
MDAQVDPLFPEVPEDLEAVSDEDLAELLREHEIVVGYLEKNDEDYTKGLSADEIIEQFEVGVEQIEKLRAEQDRRVEAGQAYTDKLAELANKARGDLAAETGDEGDGGDDGGDGEGGEEGAELADETGDGGDDGGDGDGGDGGEGEGETAADETAAEESKQELATQKRQFRRPPSPSVERMARAKEYGSPVLSSAGLQEIRAGQVMDRVSLAKAMKTTATRRGKPTKSEHGVEERILVASAQFDFPDERRLVAGDYEMNARKIAQFIPNTIPGLLGTTPGTGTLVASGGLCAPLEPIYTMPNFASAARPVRDALPTFQADRGGVNVPAATYIGDINTAITIITEAEDALGGTFATKGCQDLDCPAYTDVAVTIISHCREYGNLNAMAWPEKIAHENDLTMAGHARSAETYLLQRIKSLSLNVTQAALGSGMNAFASLAHAISAAASSIRYNLRMDEGAMFRAIFPLWIGDLLAADDALKQFADPPGARAALTAELAQYGISISYTLDAVDGTQAFSAEANSSSLDTWPATVEYALFAEGSFIHVDSGSLELGIVRDSTLNSTNDFQLFGETFENVALLGPQQGTRWISQAICPNGVFPALGTALTCS